MNKGIYTCLQEIDEEDEEQIKGNTGNWYYNEDTDQGLALKEELEELNFKVLNDTETEKDYERRKEIAKIIDKDLSTIIGYPVTIDHNDHWAFDNDDYSGEWIKVSVKDQLLNTKVKI